LVYSGPNLVPLKACCDADSVRGVQAGALAFCSRDNWPRTRSGGPRLADLQRKIRGFSAPRLRRSRPMGRRRLDRHFSAMTPRSDKPASRAAARLRPACRRPVIERARLFRDRECKGYHPRHKRRGSAAFGLVKRGEIACRRLRCRDDRGRPRLHGSRARGPASRRWWRGW